MCIHLLIKQGSSICAGCDFCCIANDAAAKDLHNVREELRDYQKSNWRVLGLELGLANVLDMIHANHELDGVERCMDEALHQWLMRNHNEEKFGRPTWKSLAAAIDRSGNRALAENIREKHN